MPQITIDVQTLREMLERKQPVVVLDIRPEEDRAEWSIPGSLHAAVYDAIKAGQFEVLQEIALPTESPVIVVCFEGVTSRIAVERLRAQGLNAFSLEGGMRAWSLAWNLAEVPLSESRAQVIQVRRTGKGCLSYLIGSEGEAAVIDPSVEPEVYVQILRQHGWRLTSVLDTHVHADHLSRALRLAQQEGATLYLPDQKRVRYPFHALQEGDLVGVGRAKLQVLHTPGHTWESCCYLLDGQALFTGDTLFLTSVGRPDLKAEPDEIRERAQALYRSLQRLLSLPGQTLILPCHTDEPLPFDNKPLCATLQEVSSRLRLGQYSEEEFLQQMIERLPPNPPNHHRIVALNEKGLFPEGEPTELEAGANRCAVSLSSAPAMPG